MSRIALTDLDAVMAIARRGTFRAAAIELGVSTTALSHAVAKFEASLGVRLFNRTSRSVALTDAGQLFIARMGPSLQGVHDALTEVRSRRETPSGVLRINAPPFAGRAILTPLVLEFLRRYPEMHVDLVTEGRLIDIVAEGFDIGVRVAHLIPNDMIALSSGSRSAMRWSPPGLSGQPRGAARAGRSAKSSVHSRAAAGRLSLSLASGKAGEVVHPQIDGPLTLDEASLVRAAVLENVGIGFFWSKT